MDAGMWLFLCSQWDRQLKFSAYASWSLSKFEFVLTTFLSKGEPKEKCWKIAITIHWFFSIFPLVPPWKLWKKSCLNNLKFWEASGNQKRSICWKFQLSISLETQKSAKIPPALGKMIKPFWFLKFSKIATKNCKNFCPNIKKVVKSTKERHF